MIYYMKYIYTVHIVNLEGRHSYYGSGIHPQNIPFHLAKEIEFLQINIRSKEKKNIFAYFLAFLSTYKQLYKFRHSIKNLLEFETTGIYPRFSFENSYKKNLRSLNPQ